MTACQSLPTANSVDETAFECEGKVYHYTTSVDDGSTLTLNLNQKFHDQKQVVFPKDECKKPFFEDANPPEIPLYSLPGELELENP